jgi:16S rRNA (cytosine967-C5)-methyltransferase
MLPHPRSRPAAREAPHIAPLDLLARAAVEVATAVEQAVLGAGKHADRAIAAVLRGRARAPETRGPALGLPDQRFISQSVFALFRWRGWIDPLRLQRPEARLLLAWLLDAPAVHPVCRVWARIIGRDPGQLVALGDAPNWTARAEGLKRWLGGRGVTADPWRLFPAWLRDHLPLPPSGASPKIRYLELLHALQARPQLWVRAQGPGARLRGGPHPAFGPPLPEGEGQRGGTAALWAELREGGLKPWVHRHVPSAARLPADADVHHLPAFQRGALEIQDLAAQAVALGCDPDPGERWWDVCAGAGGKALHLAALMEGKGVVVATDVNAAKLKETVRRARRSPFRNLTTKVWDGHRVAGKPRSFDGVLIDAPCSAIGTWRRNPDARWTTPREAIARLAELQSQILDAAALGVRSGGTLFYSVCTLTPAETMGVIRPFLDSHTDFHLDPFPHPLTGAPTDGTLLIWPQEADTDAMFLARLVRSS